MIVELYGRKIDIGEHPSKVCAKRWTGQLSPEPETVAWIESLPSGGNFFDIGANVGTFSVRAKLRGLKVFAFEPQEDNWRELQGIIARNGLAIEAYKMALYRDVSWGTLARGRSCDTFKQGPGSLISTTLDNFVRAFNIKPDYIKLDVDGNEYDILLGAVVTLPTVSSLLVEIDPMIADHAAIPGLLAEFGFRFDPKQVASCQVQEGKYKGMANYVFFR